MTSRALHTKAARLASRAYGFVIFSERREYSATRTALRSDGQRLSCVGKASCIMCNALKVKHKVPSAAHRAQNVSCLSRNAMRAKLGTSPETRKASSAIIRELRARRVSPSIFRSFIESVAIFSRVTRRAPRVKGGALWERLRALRARLFRSSLRRRCLSSDVLFLAADTRRLAIGAPMRVRDLRDVTRAASRRGWRPGVSRPVDGAVSCLRHAGVPKVTFFVSG